MLTRLNVSTGISVLDKFVAGSDCHYSRRKKKQTGLIQFWTSSWVALIVITVEEKKKDRA